MKPTTAPADDLRNVVLLSIDSIRLDRIHDHRDGVPLTPNLDDLAERSIEFLEGIAPGPGTAQSMPSLLTGAYPSQFPDYSLPPSGTEPLTLAERLSEREFSAAAFHQNNLITRRYNFDRGFDYYYDISEETRKETGEGRYRLVVRNLIEDTPLMRVARRAQTFLMSQFGRSLYKLDEPGDSLVDRGLEWFDEVDSKRHLWIHFMDTHHPYLSPSDVQREFGEPIPREEALSLSRRARSEPDSLTDTEVDRLETTYDRSVRFVDEQIGRVVDHLERTGQLEHSLIIVTGDHGEEFREHGKLGHRGDLWEELIRVPLIVYDPRLEPRRVDGQAPGLFIAETVVEGGGLYDLLEDGAEYVVAETKSGPRCCRGRGYKLLVEDDEEQVFDLERGEHETVAPSAVDDELLDAMRSRLSERHETFSGDSFDREDLEADLEALGYLE